MNRARRAIAAIALLAAPPTAHVAAQHAPAPRAEQPSMPVATYSIVARDAATGQMGVGVQSHWFSVGSVVPWAEAGVGAVATQSFVETKYGPKGLDRMRAGETPREALEALLKEDNAADVRQVAFIGTEDEAVAHTGKRCIRYASHVATKANDGSVFSAQANLMKNDGVPEAMAAAFSNAEGDLADRILAALRAAEAAGGDIRGMQSAAILIVPAQPSDRPWDDRVVDLRVDDHEQPLDELERLLTVHRAYEHMNAGDVAMEHGDTDAALREYSAAMELQPGNTEMVFWTAVSLVNADRLDDALPLFTQVFHAPDGEEWTELVRRLPASDLLPRDRDLLSRIFSVSPYNPRRPAGARPN